MVLVGIGRSHLHIFATKFSINSHSQNWIKFHLNEIRKRGEAGPGLFARRTESLITLIKIAFAAIIKSEKKTVGTQTKNMVNLITTTLESKLVDNVCRT